MNLETALIVVEKNIAYYEGQLETLPDFRFIKKAWLKGRLEGEKSKLSILQNLELSTIHEIVKNSLKETEEKDLID